MSFDTEGAMYSADPGALGPFDGLHLTSEGSQSFQREALKEDS